MEYLPPNATSVSIGLEAYDTEGRHLSSLEEKTLNIQLGKKEIFKALEDAIKKMYKGQCQLVELSCEDTFGPHLADRVNTFPLSFFSQTDRPHLKVGQEVAYLPLQSDQEVTGRITYLDTDRVTIDHNHPLSGKKICYKITLEDYHC